MTSFGSTMFTAVKPKAWNDVGPYLEGSESALRMDRTLQVRCDFVAMGAYFPFFRLACYRPCVQGPCLNAHP
jgi:hypothetical protein